MRKTFRKTFIPGLLVLQTIWFATCRGDGGFGAPSYPRSGATSVLGTPPALTRIPLNGTLFSVLDWTSKDSGSSDEDVLAADHALAPMGIPNIDTTDLATAAANPFLMVAGVLKTPSKLSAAEIRALITYVQNGGTLYLWAPSVSSLLTALGIAGQKSYSGSSVGALRPLTFDVSQLDPLLKYVDDPAEINWQFNVPTASVTIGYAATSCRRLAKWNNSGDYAVLRCDIGAGRAYVFGWPLRVSVTLPEREKVPGIEPPSTNTVVLDADISRLLMRGSYEGWPANPQIRQFAPAGHHAALIITHDVDATVSYNNVPAYVDLETSLGIKSTFLFTTNPYNTGWIGPMYVASGMKRIRYALDHGFDVESHSFGHFPDFKLAPFGTGSENASNYMPQYTETPSGSLTCCTSRMSTIGELGVSRWLLENDFGISVESFRSGFLEIPPSFFKGVSETGYRRDATFASGLTRGSFPFVGFQLVSGNVVTYSVMEYPLAISDDKINSAIYSQFLDKWEAVIRANYANNAPTILLIHPVNTGIRLQALQDILTRVSDLDLWIGDWKTFAHFWEAQGVTNARWP